MPKEDKIRQNIGKRSEGVYFCILGRPKILAGAEPAR